MFSTGPEDDKDRRDHLLACLKALNHEDKVENDFTRAVVKDGISTFESISSPCDTDFILLSKLYIVLSTIYRHKLDRAQYLAALENAKAALGRCVFREDDFMRNFVYLKSHEAKQERFFPELKQESLAALDEALSHHAKIKCQTDEDLYILVELYSAQARSCGEDRAKRIVCLQQVFTVLENIKDKTTNQFEHEIIGARIALAKQYRLLPTRNYQLALVQVQAGIKFLEAIPNKSDWHYAELSLLYHNLALDLRDLKQSNKDVLSAFLTALDASNKIKNKSNGDYKGVIKTLNYLALFYSETNQQHLVVNYLVPFFMVLGSIQVFNHITLRRAETVIHLMSEVVYCDRQLIDALYYAGKAVSDFDEPLMNAFIAFLHDYCVRSPDIVNRQTAVVLVQLITFLLNAAANKTLPNNDFKVRLEVNTATQELGDVVAPDEMDLDVTPEPEEITQLKQYRTMLQEHPIHRLSEQISHGLPFMVAATERIKHLEAETTALKAEVAQLKAAASTSNLESSEPVHKKHASLFQAARK